MVAFEENSNKVIVINDSLSKNLSILMKKNGVSESDLSRALDIPYNTIKRITSGFTSDPRMSTLKLIANYFNVSLDTLIGKDNPSQYLPDSQPPKTVPILNWSDISEPHFLNNIDFCKWDKWQPIALANTESLSRDTYALESRKSMQPRFPLGTILIIDPQEPPIDGDIILVRIKDSNEVSIRDLIIDPPHRQLLPITSNSPAILYDEGKHRIIGVVVFTIMHTRRS